MKLILGTAQMGLDYGISNSGGKISIEESHKILFSIFFWFYLKLHVVENYKDFVI